MSRAPETAFLPAALEILETPPSPVGRAVLWTIVAIFVIAVIWAVLGQVDIVALARGRIIPVGYSKVVQPLETATVTAIRVIEGQHVKAGDVLVELDTRSAQADLERLQGEYQSAQEDVTRYRRLADSPREDATLDVRTGDTLLQRQWQEFRDRIATLLRERDRLWAERRTASRQVQKLEAILPILTRRARERKGLSSKKLLSEEQYLIAEQARLESLHDLRAGKSRIEELTAAIEALDARIDLARSEFYRQTLESLDEAERRRDALAQEIIKAETRLRALTLKAPVDGRVQQLSIHTVGAVVTPAQQLMVIVPEDNELEVEAVLENRDIGFVEVGQTAEIKIDTFPFTRYGTIAGKVVNLSRDAVPDENKGLVYRMRVALERQDIEVNGKPIPLAPGMTVTVEVKTGKRRLIEYFLSPLLRYTSESVRER